MPMAPGREEVGGVGVGELLASSTLATTSTPPPRAMERTGASGVVVLELAFVSASAITSTLPGPGAGPLGEEPCEVGVAERFFVATSAQTSTSRTSDDAPPTAVRVSCVAIPMLLSVFRATHDPQMVYIVIPFTPGTGRMDVEGDTVRRERGSLRWKRFSMLRARSPGDSTAPTVMDFTAPHFPSTLAIPHTTEYVATCAPLVVRLSADAGMAMYPPSHFIRRAHRGHCLADAEARGAEPRRRTRVPRAEVSGCMPLSARQGGPQVTHAAGTNAHLHAALCPIADTPACTARARTPDLHSLPMRAAPMMTII